MLELILLLFSVYYLVLLENVRVCFLVCIEYDAVNDISCS